MAVMQRYKSDNSSSYGVLYSCHVVVKIGVCLLVCCPVLATCDVSSNKQENTIASNGTQGYAIVYVEGRVIPKEFDTVDASVFGFLTDTWWKLFLWLFSLVLLILTFCYFTRCCYLIWDCCTDPYWGCWPRKEACKRFMLIQCFDTDYDNDAEGSCYCCMDGVDKYEYQICCNNAGSQRATFHGASAATNPQRTVDDSSKLSEMDLTLKQEEFELQDSSSSSRWKDTSLTVISEALGNKSMGSQSLAYLTPIHTSPKLEATTTANPTNRNQSSGSWRNSELPFSVDEEVIVTACEEEVAPHVHEGHYFNILNFFGLGSDRCEYSVVVKSSQNDLTTKQGHQKRRKVDGKFQKDNEDFLLSSSFNNVSCQKYGLHIGEGKTGRYKPLPEAQSQLLPPEKFVLLQTLEKQTLMTSRRRSRSMDAFARLHNIPYSKNTNADKINSLQCVVSQANDLTLEQKRQPVQSATLKKMAVLPVVSNPIKEDDKLNTKKPPLRDPISDEETAFLRKSLKYSNENVSSNENSSGFSKTFSHSLPLDRKLRRYSPLQRENLTDYVLEKHLLYGKETTL